MPSRTKAVVAVYACFSYCRSGLRSTAILAAVALVLVLPLRAGEPSNSAGGAFRDGAWPFSPPKRPAVPPVADPAWCRNEVDRFILAELEKLGLRPAPPADRAAWLRRVTFDLTGLPPTHEALQAFLADNGPGAQELVVDRLLASPAYGERAALFWLDLVRYAETDGFKADGHRPNAYKYRDYAIDAFNADMPYQRFFSQQLAGDELEPDNPQALAATGYLRLYPDEYNAANLEQRRQEILDDITDTTALAFLGLTVGCARCHDHKFDDILQTDYYRLQAFFAPLFSRDDLPQATPAEQAEFSRQESAWLTATQAIREEMESLIGGQREALRREALGKFREEIQRCVRMPAAERSPFERQIASMAMKQAVEKDSQAVARLSAGDKARFEALQASLKEFDAIKPAPLPTLMTASDVGPTAPQTFVLATGNWRTPLAEVQPGFPEFLHLPAANCVPGACEIQGRENTTGRRAALARWLTRDDHPLTTRVLANRLWQQHFGVGLAPTGNDFGVQGQAATHRELLDWLAVELNEGGGSLKRIHRLLTTSAAYGQSSLVDPDSAEYRRAASIDPNHAYLWHARRRRLEGEAIRDSMLALGGQLNLRPGGPSARPELPAGISKNYAWQPDEQLADRHRRSVYVLAKRNLRFPLFDAFDSPDMHQSCSRRIDTTTAPQALLLLNGEFCVECSRRWADRLALAAGDDDERFVVEAYRQAFCRLPSPDESAAARQFLVRQAEVLSAVQANATAPAGSPVPSPGAAARVDFCHALFNSNEFLYVD